MATASQLLERLQNLNLRDTLVSSIEETAADYAVLNTGQMYEGLDGTGQKILPQYKSPQYAREKNYMNPLPGYGYPDAHLTGAFYRGYRLTVEGDELVKDSNVDYADKLFEKYDNELGQLDEENHEKYIDEALAPVFYDKVREETGLL